MVLSNHSSVCFLTKAFWVLPFLFFLLLKSLCGAQVGKPWRHTFIAYFAKSNNGSREKNIIRSNQDVWVCGYKVAILILLCSLKHFSLFIETLKRPFVRTWAIFYSFLFFSFFSCHSFSFITFFIALCLFSLQNFWERDYTYLEHLFWKSLTNIFLFTPGVGVEHFFGGS